MGRDSRMSVPTMSRRRFIVTSVATLSATSVAGAADTSHYHHEAAAAGLIDAALTAFESHRIVATSIPRIHHRTADRRTADGALRTVGASHFTAMPATPSRSARLGAPLF
jgi:hypothetical protein